MKSEKLLEENEMNKKHCLLGIAFWELSYTLWRHCHISITRQWQMNSAVPSKQLQSTSSARSFPVMLRINSSSVWSYTTSYSRMTIALEVKFSSV